VVIYLLLSKTIKRKNKMSNDVIEKKRISLKPTENLLKAYKSYGIHLINFVLEQLGKKQMGRKRLTKGSLNYTISKFDREKETINLLLSEKSVEYLVAVQKEFNLKNLTVALLLVFNQVDVESFVMGLKIENTLIKYQKPTI
jgi:hypothetical protein